jgi:hypothetical protein
MLIYDKLGGMKNDTRLPGLALMLAFMISLPVAAYARTTTKTPDVAVGAQFDTTHVYVPAADFDRCVASLIATFGGRKTPQGVFTVTPTPSKTKSQLVLTPVGTMSIFGFETPIPYPFGAERTGYLVVDFAAGVRAAQTSGADLIVAPFTDPLGKDAIVQWPGGVNMQLYWHTIAPKYNALISIPENRVYVSPQSVTAFVRAFLAFSHGTVTSDVSANGREIGRPKTSFRRIRIASHFGGTTILVTDGILPYPYGREVTGYGVNDLTSTLAKAKAAGAIVLDGPYVAAERESAMVRFPGGFIAEIHSRHAEK